MTRILVVDDLKDITETMGLLFETLGHDTKVATDGRQAVEETTAFEPEIVFGGSRHSRPQRQATRPRARSAPRRWRCQPFLIALTSSLRRGRRRSPRARSASTSTCASFFADTNALLALVADLSTRTRPSP